jgi:hypothetical protein
VILNIKSTNAVTHIKPLTIVIFTPATSNLPVRALILIMYDAIKKKSCRGREKKVGYTSSHAKKNGTGIRADDVKTLLALFTCHKIVRALHLLIIHQYE